MDAFAISWFLGGIGGWLIGLGLGGLALLYFSREGIDAQTIPSKIEKEGVIVWA